MNAASIFRSGKLTRRRGERPRQYTSRERRVNFPDRKIDAALQQTAATEANQSLRSHLSARLAMGRC